MDDWRDSPAKFFLGLLAFILLFAFVWAFRSALDGWGWPAAVAVAAAWLSAEGLLWRAIARKTERKPADR